MTVLAWIVIAPVALVAQMAIANRLLGIRRAWWALAASGVLGFIGGVVAGGLVTGWRWDTAAMVVSAFVFGVIFTMMVALLIDLLARADSFDGRRRTSSVAIRNPIDIVRKRLQPLRRYREIIQLAHANGVVAHGVTAASLPVGIRRTLEQAGGIFVKLGQVASTRTDLLPPAWCDELTRLRSRAEPVDVDVMRPYLEQELGARPDDVFAKFDWTPMASASMSQVYRAQLEDGTPVVVKVLRPDLDETVERDAAAVMQLANVIQRHSSVGLSIQPVELATEFLDDVREELDFRIEANNAIELSAALAGIERLRIPIVDGQRSGQRFLTEEFIEAPSVDELESRGMAATDRAAVADRLASAFMWQIFRVGVFHADPHPGNILVEADGTIVLIDLGAVGHLGNVHRSAVIDMMTAATRGDGTSLRQALGRITVIDRTVDLRELDVAIETFLGRHLRAGGSISASTFEDLAVLVGHYGIRLPRWFGTLSRTLVTLEGTLRELDADFSLIDAAKTHAGEVAGAGAGSVSAWRDALEQEAMTQLPLLRRVPEQINHVLAQLADGTLSAQVSLLTDQHDERVVTRLVDRAVLALVASATGIGSVLLLGVDSGPNLGGSIPMNELIGYSGLAASTVLALRVVAGIVRDGST